MQLTATIRIVFAVWLTLANAWCVTACNLLPCLPKAAAHQKSHQAPCHQAPPSDDAERQCAHPIVAESLAGQSADGLTMALAAAVLPDQFALPLLLIATYGDHEPPGLAWRAAPSKTIILRV